MSHGHSEIIFYVPVFVFPHAVVEPSHAIADFVQPLHGSPTDIAIIFISHRCLKNVTCVNAQSNTDLYFGNTNHTLNF